MEKRELYDELRYMAARNVCAECGGDLVVAWDGERSEYVLRCGRDKSHHGMVEIETPTEIRRRGGALPVYVAQEIDKKGALALENPVKMADVIMVRFTELDLASAVLFAYYCLRMGLDPLLGEIYPSVFKRRAKVKGEEQEGRYVVVPIISETGYGSLAARACPGAWNGPPTTERVTDPELKRDLCGDENAWMYSASGRRKDWEPERIYTTHGWLTQDQYKKAKERGTPAGELPGNQARVRAIKRWYNESFPEAASLIRGMRKALLEQADGLTEAMEIIEAEYHVVEPGADEGREAGPAKLETPALQELPADPRLIAWNIVRGLLKETRPWEGMVTKWFRDCFSIDVEMKDFDQDEPPEKFTEPMLSRFHDALLKLKEEKTQKPKG